MGSKVSPQSGVVQGRDSEGDKHDVQVHPDGKLEMTRLERVLQEMLDEQRKTNAYLSLLTEEEV